MAPEDGKVPRRQVHALKDERERSAPARERSAREASSGYAARDAHVRGVVHACPCDREMPAAPRSRWVAQRARSREGEISLPPTPGYGAPAGHLPHMLRGIAQNRLVFFMMRRNSSSFTSPSPSRSASSIISCSSSSVIRSPSSFATRLRFLNEIFPVSSSSNSLNALRISSLGSRFRILCVIIFKNSSYPIVPLPSSSTSEIIFWISSFFGSNPSARIATFSSFESMEPLPSVSKRSKASLISCFCSSVSSFCFLPPALKRRSAMFSRDDRLRGATDVNLETTLSALSQ